MPSWFKLPMETQAALTTLMTRLCWTMPASAGWVRRGTVMISDKIRPQHLERKAILYVRQSSAHQVLHNRESSALQYAMRDRLTTLGWSEIEVIDDDLGRSAAGSVQRAGFERMVSQPLQWGWISSRTGPHTIVVSTLGDNRRRIILVIEPLSQSDRANSNSCFSD